MFAERSETVIHFAHPAYRLAERFALRDTGITYFQTWNQQQTLDRVAEATVAVMSGFWDARMLELAPRLGFIQVPAAGYEQFDLAELRARGIHLANGRGVAANAVAEHAIALMLSFTRHLHTARDNQNQHHWRGMLSDLDAREDELAGKTLLVYGLGTIGERLAKLARAFDMHVIGIKRDTGRHDANADRVCAPGELLDNLPLAHFVALTCPLTPDTESLLDSEAFSAMRNDAVLINVARGRCVDETALLAALQQQSIAGAGIDTTVVEPLPADSPLWGLGNVVITPHTGGETRCYEDNVIDLLLTNLEALWRGETKLVNQIV